MNSVPSVTVLQRPRLHARLESSRFVALVAPSGFGKSTLLRAWAQDREAAGASVTWLALTERMESAAEFWRAVVNAGRARGLIEDADDALGRLATGEDPVKVLTSGDSWGRDVLLVVDAFEHAADLGVEDGLFRLSAAWPGVTLALASRTAPRLTDPLVRARHEITLLDADDLAFTPGEIGELLERAGRPVSEVETVHEGTSGYPLAVRVHLLGGELGGGVHPPSGSAATAADALLSTLRPPLADFLRSIALAPYVDLPLAERLSGSQDAARLIAEVEREGLGRWIPHEREQPVFQLSDAVRTIVRRTTAVDAAVFRAACGEVAAWLLDKKEYEGALRAALEAGRFDIAGPAVGRLLTTATFEYAAAILVPRLRGVSPQDLARHPVLAFAYGVALLSQVATRSAAAPYLRISARARPTDAGIIGPNSLGMVRVVSLRSLRRFSEAAAAARDAVRAMAEDRSLHGPHAREGRVTAYGHFAYTMLLDGDIEGARAASAEAMAEAYDPQTCNRAFGWAAGIEALDGRVRSAEVMLARTDPSAWRPGQDRSYDNALGRVARATVLLDAFKPDAALLEYLDCAFAEVTEFWAVAEWTRGLAALMKQGHVADARRTAEQLAGSQPPPGIGDNLVTAMLRCMLGIQLLAAGHDSAAAGVLAIPVRHRAQLAPGLLLAKLQRGDAAGAVQDLEAIEGWHGHTVRSRAAVATLGAAAARRLGQRTLALTLLEEAASLFSTYGVQAQLALIPAEDLAALRRLAEAERTAIGYLTASVEGTAYPEVVVLTERELEVMQALLRHRTRDEVAAALHLSVNTVKVHLRTAYRKLGAATREEAVERVLELRLLER